MGHCKDCKFWRYRETCGAIKWAETGEAKPKNSSAAVHADALDDSGMHAELKTGPGALVLRFGRIRRLGGM